MTDSLPHDRNGISPRTDASLFEAMKSQDESRFDSAWGRFDRVYRPFIVRIVRRHGCSSDVAEDIAQTCMQQLNEDLAGFVVKDRPGSFRRYLTKMIGWRLKDHWKRESGKPVAAGGTDALGLISQTPDPNGSRDHEVTLSETQRAAIETVVSDARARCRSHKTFECYEMHELHGLSLEEVAERLDLTVASVKKNVQRVRQYIREAADNLLDGYGDAPPPLPTEED